MPDPATLPCPAGIVQSAPVGSLAKGETLRHALDFDATAPFGAYRLGGFQRRRLSVCHSLPAIRPLQQLGLALRRPLKYGLDHPVDVEIWGLRLRLMPYGNISEGRLLFVPQFFDRMERRALARFLKPGCVFFDIGANAGAYSFWVYSLFRQNCRIVAVEPDPELGRRIEFNRKTNAARNLTLYGCALSNRQGTGVLCLGADNKGRNCLGDSATDRSQQRVRVPVTTLYDLVQAARVAGIDALKIDVEGHDRVVLEDYFARAPEPLWPRMVLCETGTSPEQQQLAKDLVALGYRLGPANRRNQVLYRDR